MVVVVVVVVLIVDCHAEWKGGLFCSHGVEWCWKECGGYGDVRGQSLSRGNVDEGICIVPVGETQQKRQGDHGEINMRLKM